MNNQYKNNFNIDFSIFITQTILIILYPYLSFHKLLSPAISLLIVVSALLLNLRNKQINIFAIRWVLLFSLLISSSFINANLSSLQSDKIILFFSQIAYFYSAATLLQNNEYKVEYISIIIALVITTSLYGIWQYFTGFNQLNTFIHTQAGIQNTLIFKTIHSQLSTKNITSIFTNKNIFSSFILISLPLFFYSLKNIKANLPLLILSIIPLTAMYLASSQAGYLLFFATIYFIFIIKTPKKQLFTLILLFLLVLITTKLNPDYFIHLKGSIQSRTYYYKTALEIIRKYFLFGTGLNSFKDEYILHMKSYYEITKHAHNYLLEIATECGTMQSIIIFCLFAKIIFFSEKHNLQSFDIKDNQVSLNTDQIHNNIHISQKILFITLTPVFSAILLFPPFTFFPVEYSGIISLLLFIGCLTLALFIKKLLHKSNFPIKNTIYITTIILLLHSFISISFNKLVIGTLFFGFLGFLSKKYSQTNHITKLDKMINNILKGIFIIGIIIITIYLSSNYFYLKARTHLKQKQFDKAEKYLKISKTISPFHFDTHLSYLKIKLINYLKKNDEKGAIKTCSQFETLSKISPKNHLVWSELAKILSKYPELKYLSSYQNNAITNTLKLAPFHSKTMLIKAINLERHNQPKQALVTYLNIVKINKNKKFNYILTLKDKELNFVKLRIIQINSYLNKKLLK